MKHTTLLVLSLLFTVNAFTQNNQNPTEGFSMIFYFKYKTEAIYNIHIISSEDGGSFSFLNSDCGATQRKENISDTYNFNQFTAVLKELDIINFKPQDNNHDITSDLRVDVQYTDHVTHQMNAFSFQHNPDIEDNENRILEFLIEALNDNTTRSCNRDVVNELRIAIDGNNE
jgi:hypothetical protein